MSADVKFAPTLEAMVRAGARNLAGSQSPRLDARVLAKFVLGCDDAELISRAEELPDETVTAHFDELLLRRAGGEPVAYITGEKEFWGIPFRVTPDVLIPRADSECLVETICEQTDAAAPLRILDLGTGSGCLLCALLRELPQATGVGVDISAGAVEIARENADKLGLSDRAAFIVSDWFEHVAGVFDIVVANAPYIPDGDRPGLIIDVSDFEPSEALFGGADGLDAYRRIFNEVGAFLRPSGLFVCEYGDASQGEALRAIVATELAKARVTVIRDLAARERGAAIRLASGKKD